jgi:hypothetical protein
LTSFGVAAPTKFKEIGSAVAELGAVSQLLQQTVADARADLMATVDKAMTAYTNLDNLGRELAAGGRREIDKILKQPESLDGIDLSRLDFHTRAIVEDVLAKLESAAPPDVNPKALLQTLSVEQQQKVQAEASAFQEELEALRKGEPKPPEPPRPESPNFQQNSRLMRV